MTAPDPGLTDLLAVTLIANSTLDVSNGERLWGAFPNTMTIDDLADALALVVEQHTNRRIAELEAERDAMAAHYVTAIGLRDLERNRAEKAEATVARVEALEPFCGMVDLEDLHTALEGGQR